MPDNTAAVLAHYGLQGEVNRLGQGHIHDTYRVTGPEQTEYVLQRVNEYVFRDGDLVMDQTLRVLACWEQQSRYMVPQLQPALDGASSVRMDGELWRVWRYLADTRVVEPISASSQVYEAARAFSSFQLQMRKLPSPRLRDTISNFLDLNAYLQAYAEVATAAPTELDRLVQESQVLAQRYTERNTTIHGDCKVNNVLFDSSGNRVVAVIDFDTVMYGHWAWDFGDLVRSVCFSAGGYQPELYSECVRGFVEIQPQLADHGLALVEAPAYVAVMLAVRFLTDHLSGDQYFRVAQHGENLVRAQQQFEVYRQFVAARLDMARLVEAQAKAVSG